MISKLKKYLKNISVKKKVKTNKFSFHFKTSYLNHATVNRSSVFWTGIRRKQNPSCLCSCFKHTSQGVKQFLFQFLHLDYSLAATECWVRHCFLRGSLFVISSCIFSIFLLLWIALKSAAWNVWSKSFDPSAVGDVWGEKVKAENSLGLLGLIIQPLCVWFIWLGSWNHPGILILFFILGDKVFWYFWWIHSHAANFLAYSCKIYAKGLFRYD